jgi:hypothetical protein
MKKPQWLGDILNFILGETIKKGMSVDKNNDEFVYNFGSVCKNLTNDQEIVKDYVRNSELVVKIFNEFVERNQL